MTTITGNYAGVAGSTLKMDTVLGNDASATDKLIINGNTTGATSLSVNNVGGTGAQTVEGIQVVQVDGASSGTFALTSPVQAGSYEYQLFQGGTSTPTDGDWYLRSTLLACEITNTCPVVPPVEPEPPVIPIYRPGVANYVVAQTSNADLGYLALDTLHQRIGEQRTLTTDNPQTWVRAIAGYTSNNGKNRFEYDQTTVGFQIGRDLLHDTTGSGTQQRAGLTTQYLRGNVDTRDRVRPIARLSEDTGHIQSTAHWFIIRA
jgi:autotransporter family porin